MQQQWCAKIELVWYFCLNFLEVTPPDANGWQRAHQWAVICSPASRFSSGASLLARDPPHKHPQILGIAGILRARLCYCCWPSAAGSCLRLCACIFSITCAAVTPWRSQNSRTTAASLVASPVNAANNCRQKSAFGSFVAMAASPRTACRAHLATMTEEVPPVEAGSSSLLCRWRLQRCLGVKLGSHVWKEIRTNRLFARSVADPALKEHQWATRSLAWSAGRSHQSRAALGTWIAAALCLRLQHFTFPESGMGRCLSHGTIQWCVN